MKIQGQDQSLMERQLTPKTPLTTPRTAKNRKTVQDGIVTPLSTSSSRRRSSRSSYAGDAKASLKSALAASLASDDDDSTDILASPKLPKLKTPKSPSSLRRRSLTPKSPRRSFTPKSPGFLKAPRSPGFLKSPKKAAFNWWKSDSNKSTQDSEGDGLPLPLPLKSPRSSPRSERSTLSTSEHKPKSLKSPRSERRPGKSPRSERNSLSMSEQKAKEIKAPKLKTSKTPKSPRSLKSSKKKVSKSVLSEKMKEALYGEMDLADEPKCGELDSMSDVPQVPRRGLPRRNSLNTLHANKVRARRRGRKKTKNVSLEDEEDPPAAKFQRSGSNSSLDFDENSSLDFDDIFSTPEAGDENKRSKSLPDLGRSFSRRLTSPSCIKGSGGSDPLDRSNHSVRFSAKIEEQEIEAFKDDMSAVLFYDENEIGEMRNEAFLEKCGLDPSDFADL